MIERILFLEGLPNPQNPGKKLRIGGNVPEILRCDLGMELDAPFRASGLASPTVRPTRTTSAAICSTPSLCLRRKHVDWLETQIELIEKVGLQNYQQSQT